MRHHRTTVCSTPRESRPLPRGRRRHRTAPRFSGLPVNRSAYRGAMSIAQRERAALVEILRAVGPDAPTLCEGWTTRDLTAHLVVRERRPDALPGLLFGPLASHTARVQNQLTTSTKWEDLVDLFASGPPVLSLFKILDPVASIHEMFVHHEDLRRAQTGW